MSSYQTVEKVLQNILNCLHEEKATTNVMSYKCSEYIDSGSIGSTCRCEVASNKLFLVWFFRQKFLDFYHKHLGSEYKHIIRHTMTYIEQK